MPEKEQKSAERDDGTAVLMEIGKPALYHFFVRNRKAYRGAAGVKRLGNAEGMIGEQFDSGELRMTFDKFDDIVEMAAGIIDGGDDRAAQDDFFFAVVKILKIFLNL